MLVYVRGKYDSSEGFVKLQGVIDEIQKHCNNGRVSFIFIHLLFFVIDFSFTLSLYFNFQLLLIDYIILLFLHKYLMTLLKNSKNIAWIKGMFCYFFNTIFFFA